MNEICGFCGRNRNQIEFLIAGPKIGVGTCCLPTLVDIMNESISTRKEPRPCIPSGCSDLFGPCCFCGKAKRGDEQIVGSMSIDDVVPVICHDCIDLCLEILAEEREKRKAKSDEC